MGEQVQIGRTWLTGESTARTIVVLHHEGEET